MNGRKSKQRKRQTSPRLNLCQCLQCSRASVTLADKLPSVSGERLPTAPGRKEASVSLGSSPPSTGGYKSSSTVSIEGEAEGIFSEGNFEGVAEGVAEDNFKDGDQGQDKSRDGVVWNRLTLELGDVCVEKVVEKGALGTTAKGAMAVSCREAS